MVASSLDRHGLALGGNHDAIAAYEAALEDLVAFRFEVIGATEAAQSADPTCIMAGVLGAYLPLMSTEADAIEAATASLDAIEEGSNDPTPRELAHLEAARAWAAGSMLHASDILEGIAIQYPKDLLALAVGHQIDFFTGDARRLRDRIGRALGSWDNADPTYGYLCGMAAFGFEEANHYDRAADFAAFALDANDDDVWAIHARAHTYEMQGDIARGISFLNAHEPVWSSHNLLRVHNSWHYALFLLEGAAFDDVLAIYDREIRGPQASGAAFELVDASALLWRLHLEGVDVGDRFTLLADAWRSKVAPGYYPFNDCHAALAFVGAGALDDATSLVDDLVSYVALGDDGSTGWQMTARVGLAVCEAIVAFANDDVDVVIEQLWPLRGRLHEFGGSHAQRDVVERTLVQAAMKGDRALAAALIDERICVRPASAFAWSRKAALSLQQGDSDGQEAAIAELAVIERAVNAAVR